MAGPTPPFRVDHSRALLEAVKNLQQRAIERGLGVEFNQALAEIVFKLQNSPTEWGDPQFTLKHSGMTVYRGIRSPLQVSYAATPEQGYVILRAVLPLPGTSLPDS